MNIHDTRLNEMSANGRDYAAEMKGAETERKQRRRRREAVNRRVAENNKAMRSMMQQKK